jgi:hypothetical protein
MLRSLDDDETRAARCQPSWATADDVPVRPVSAGDLRPLPDGPVHRSPAYRQANPLREPTSEVSHPVVPHPRTGHVKITRIGRGAADDSTTTGAARPVLMEKPR